MRNVVLTILPLASILFMGVMTCSISDKDRCPSGYYYSEDYLSCLIETDPEKDGSVAVTDGGFGTICSDDDDCVDLTSDFCAINPVGSDDEGYCTITDCTPADCPDAWQCCDCSSLGWVVLCLDDGFAETAESMGCSCD